MAMDPDQRKSFEQACENALDATLTDCLEEPMKALICFARNQSSELSDLWKIVSTAKSRVSSLQDLTDIFEDEGLRQTPRERVINWFGNLADKLAQRSLEITAVQILIELWSQLGQCQATLNATNASLRHFSRAAVGMYLGRIYLQSDLGAAAWWLLHAHADDLLGEHKEGGGAARDMLRLSFGVGEDVFSYMKKLSEKSLNSDQRHMWYAEHLVMQLSLRPEFSRLFAFPTLHVEFPIDRAYAEAMLTRVEKKADGKPLEELARYLMGLLAGWVPTSNVYHPRTRMDSDVLVRYLREPEAISSAYTRAILVECKNVDNPLSVSAVGYFLYRMYLQQVKVGILFAKKNVSGNQEQVDQERFAKHLLTLAFQKDGSAVIVVDLDDLRDLVYEGRTVWSLIESRALERRFGKESAAATDVV